MKLPHYITTFPIRQERPAGALRRGHLAVRHTASRWHRMNGAVIFAEHSPKVRPRLSHIPDRDRRPRLSGKTSPFAHTSPWSVHRFLPKQAPSLGRGAPWCSRGNDPICTDKPKITPVGMRVRCVRVPPHQSAALTASPSQGEAFLFAFGRC